MSGTAAEVRKLETLKKTLTLCSQKADALIALNKNSKKSSTKATSKQSVKKPTSKQSVKKSSSKKK